MRFEHLIEINAPHSDLGVLVPTFSREQLWHGLLQRVQAPQRFPMGPERCEWREVEPGLVRRTLFFGSHELHDEVSLESGRSVVFTPEPHGDAAPIRLRISIEEPRAGLMVLRFVYEALAEQSEEERYYNGYRHNAWLHNDRDMVRTLRQWLCEGGL